jgi:hypothetical protein
MTARRLRGGLDDGTYSREVDDGTGSRENFGWKLQPDGKSKSLQALGLQWPWSILFIGGPQ